MITPYKFHGAMRKQVEVLSNPNNKGNVFNYLRKEIMKSEKPIDTNSFVGYALTQYGNHLSDEGV